MCRWYHFLDGLMQKIANREALEVEEMDSLQVQIATHPFSAEGTMRWPYHAAVIQHGQPVRYQSILVLEISKFIWPLLTKPIIYSFDCIARPKETLFSLQEYGREEVQSTLRTQHPSSALEGALPRPDGGADSSRTHGSRV